MDHFYTFARALVWKLLGINAQLPGSDSAQEAALWEWIANQVGHSADHANTVLFLHRPMLRPRSGELARKGRYVSRAATERLLKGPLQSTLRLVVSGHAHQYIDGMKRHDVSTLEFFKDRVQVVSTAATAHEV